MIDLSRTRNDLLREVGAMELSGDILSDVTDPRVARMDVSVQLCGRSKDDLFPLLNLALSQRFAAVPRMQLIRDLMLPLRNALGNACKHGNDGDPAKAVSVELVLTGKGTVIAITDQGRGFDVALTFQRFQEQQTYFMNRGQGFRALHSAMSTVTYENDGRTLLLCFRPACGNSDRMSFYQPETTQLSEQVPEFVNGHGSIQSCRVFAAGGCADNDIGTRYLLRIAADGARPAATKILTRRLHATEADAEADFEAARQLCEASISKSVLVPRPVGRFANVVLYDFDPWLNLREYLSCHVRPKTLRHCAERIGRTLAALHASRIVVRTGPSPVACRPLSYLVEPAQASLRTHPLAPALMENFLMAVTRLPQASSWRPAPSPIHGTFGWDRIYYGVDGIFYLYGFEQCRISDPGFDLGGFSADLLCFALTNHDYDVYRVCRDEFLMRYNSKSDVSISERDLCFYTAWALLDRVQNLESGKGMDARQLIRALDALSRSEVGVSAEAVS